MQAPMYEFVGVRVDTETKVRLETIARNEKRDVSAVVREIISTRLATLDHARAA